MTTDVTDFGDRLQYLFRRIDGALSQRLEEALRPHSLTQAQLSALAQLRVAEPEALSNARLSERAGITAQSMSSAISGLLDRGLVARGPNASHGRTLDVRLTDAGRALLTEVQEQTARLDAPGYLGLDADEEDALRLMLRKVAAGLGIFLPGEQRIR